jgi:hypothetical protein
MDVISDLNKEKLLQKFENEELRNYFDPRVMIEVDSASYQIIWSFR